ncbi:hypothetical protein OAS95_04625 [Pelagibacteraceae bacterium]|jgi:hypothetical protein|nr:hypothetical protein [Pelagibacteraceae bacterium]
MKMEYSYPIQLTIEYSNDTEYRHCLRKLFKMNPTNYPDISEMNLDEITKDEQSYDLDAANITMDYILEITNTIPEVINLYEKTASFMFSTDPNIGLTIMLGYDYLDLFHQLIIKIVSGISTEELLQTDVYKQLYAKIYK